MSFAEDYAEYQQWKNTVALDTSPDAWERYKELVAAAEVGGSSDTGLAFDLLADVEAYIFSDLNNEDFGDVIRSVYKAEFELRAARFKEREAE